MNNCLHCVNWNPRASTEMAKLRFGRCEINEKWIFFGPYHTCEKFDKTEDSVIEKRMKWDDAHTKTFMAAKGTQP